MIGENLPEHLIVEILSWLPVKAVFRFKSICRSWYAITKTRYFISMHLQNYCSTNFNRGGYDGCLFVNERVTQAGEMEFYELLLDETASASTFQYKFEEHMPASSLYLCGPCDGIYYTWRPGFDNDRYLWNPTIQEHKALPPIIIKLDLPPNVIQREAEAYGFGLNPVTHDYQVVVLASYDEIDRGFLIPSRKWKYPLSIIIYSLRTNSWRYWGELDKFYELTHDDCYNFVDGCCYWLGSDDESFYFRCTMMVSFNMATDAYQVMRLPEYDLKAYTVSLGIYHGSIALFTLSKNTKQFHIWALNATGSWTMSFTITLPDSLRFSCPIGHWRNNTVLFANYGLFLYDPNTQEFMDLEWGWLGYKCRGAIAYMESLVPIKDWRGEVAT